MLIVEITDNSKKNTLQFSSVPCWKTQLVGQLGAILYADAPSYVVALYSSLVSVNSTRRDCIGSAGMCKCLSR